jgi:hypothetical protein
MGVLVILAGLAAAGYVAFGFVICASTGSSCGGSALPWELIAIAGGGFVIGTMFLLSAWGAWSGKSGGPK